MKQALKALAAFALIACGCVSRASAQCERNAMTGAMSGVWLVRDAGGDEFSKWFVNGKGKVFKETFVTIGYDTVVIGRSGDMPMSFFAGQDVFTRGGFWCSPASRSAEKGTDYPFSYSFTIGDYPARLSYVGSGWWDLQVGADNKVTLSKRRTAKENGDGDEETGGGR